MRRWAILVGVVLAVALRAAAQQPVPPPEGERGRLRAERVRYDARNGVFEARGNVQLELGDTTITCEVLTYHERDRVAWAEGKVEVVQHQPPQLGVAGRVGGDHHQVLAGEELQGGQGDALGRGEGGRVHGDLHQVVILGQDPEAAPLRVRVPEYGRLLSQQLEDVVGWAVDEGLAVQQVHVLESQGHGSPSLSLAPPVVV